jgi:drug/metabolite transporter (DMT)-like permease
MNWDRIFSPQGLNWWIIVSGIGLNFVLMAFLMLGVIYAAESELSAALVTTVMSLGGFLIPLFTAYLCGRMGDERFLAYAFYPLVGYLIPIVFSVAGGDILGVLLMVAFGGLGALNGGNLAARRATRRRHSISGDE